MDSLSLFANLDYFSAASNIEQKLGPRGFSHERENTLIGLLDDDEPGHTSPLHSTWGEWLYWWDAIDFMETRLESEDVVRKVFPVEDIVYHWHYIPYRGHKDDIFNSADMQFSYEDYEDGIFYLGPAEVEEMIAYTSSPASYLPPNPDDGIEENKDAEEKDNPLANDIQIEADDTIGPDAERAEAAEAQKENPSILLEAIRLLFVSGKQIIAAKAQTL